MWAGGGHHKSPADSANGAVAVNGPAALSAINDAYRAQSIEDLLHFSLRSSFDAATDNNPNDLWRGCGLSQSLHIVYSSTYILGRRSDVNYTCELLQNAITFF